MIPCAMALSLLGASSGCLPLEPSIATEQNRWKSKEIKKIKGKKRNPRKYIEIKRNQKESDRPHIPINPPPGNEIANWNSERILLETRVSNRNLRKSKEIKGNRGKSKEIEGNRWKSKEIEGNRRKSKEIEGNPRKSKEIEGNRRKSQEIEGNRRKSKKTEGNRRKSKKIEENRRKSGRKS